MIHGIFSMITFKLGDVRREIYYKIIYYRAMEHIKYCRNINIENA